MDLIQLYKKSDARGWLSEILKDELKTGQIYYFTINPNKMRGGHYHNQKDESFCIISGKVILRLLNKDTGEKTEVELSAEDKTISKIFVPRKVKHTFYNPYQKTASIIAFITKKFDREDPDTFFD